MPESALASRGARAAGPRAAILARAVRGERGDQESRTLLAEAARRGYRLVCDPISEDDGDRADDDRAGLRRALQLVDAGAIDVLLVADLPRLGRSVSCLSRVVERLRAHHVALVSVRESIDLSTTAGRVSGMGTYTNAPVAGSTGAFQPPKAWSIPTRTR